MVCLGHIYSEMGAQSMTCGHLCFLTFSCWSRAQGQQDYWLIFLKSIHLRNIKVIICDNLMVMTVWHPLWYFIFVFPTPSSPLLSTCQKIMPTFIFIGFIHQAGIYLDFLVSFYIFFSLVYKMGRYY